MKQLISLAFLSVLTTTVVYSQKITPSIRYYNNTKEISRTNINDKKSVITDSNNCKWQFNVEESPVDGDKEATDLVFTWQLIEGYAKEVAMAVDFSFDNWTPENFVFVPAIVYDGNRFEVKNINYPPFWYDLQEWRLDMPVTTTNQPTLGKGEGPGKIELTTGNCSTPLMSFFSKKDKKGWIIQTNQGNNLGNYGLFIEENKPRDRAVFSITAPAVRERAAQITSHVDSKDKAADIKKGESITIKCRVYDFKADEIKNMMSRFLDVRKDFNNSSRKEVLPYSKSWEMLNNLYQQSRWDERINMYWLSDVRESATWNFVWQLGWCGGGQSTLPILLRGSEDDKGRAIKNLDAIYTKTQAKSGFFYAYGDGKEFFGFGYGSPLKNNETFVRSQGDWLYMAQRQFSILNKQGTNIPKYWIEGTKKQADAFVRLWDKYGQFGQFLNIETGDICIGGSTAGASVIAGLTLASKTYNDGKYLEVAKQAARKFYVDFVKKGYTVGGPGEILSAPDSESAFGLFESFMVLYEHTLEKEWLDYASELLPICASWTVSYDYNFPKDSPMNKIDAHSCGSVWASVANKHSAPGICNWSGESILNYYRATNDIRALELITDIAHGITQYISRNDQKLGHMPEGGICERVNLSDWESKDGIGSNIFDSCSWCEVAVMLTSTQLPSLYINPKTGVFTVFDNISVNKLPNGDFCLKNTTNFDSQVRVFVENKEKSGKNFRSIEESDMKIIDLKAGEEKIFSL